MGKAFAKLFGKKDMRILMLGLDAAGKTSILPLACSVHVYMYIHVDREIFVLKICGFNFHVKNILSLDGSTT